MRHTVLGLFTAGLLAGSVSLAAQSPATTTDSKWDSKEMTLSGCVEKTKSGGYFLIAENRDSTPTGTSGSTPTTTTAETTTSDKNAPPRGTAWNLGQSDKFERYVGQRIQVVGHAERGTSGDQLKGTHGSSELNARDFDVKSVTMIAASCR